MPEGLDALEALFGEGRAVKSLRRGVPVELPGARPEVFRTIDAAAGGLTRFAAYHTYDRLHLDVVPWTNCKIERF